jgi:lipopolysaccharide transport system ATP-binding protein
MSSPVISVQGLGKRYVIGHQARLDTLRDRLAHGARNLWRSWRRTPRETKEDFWALRDVSFDVQQGDVVGIIGRNGAGKSTLLKILSRITEPTEGRVALRGRVASLLEVGTGFHPELTGRENIFLNGAILGMSHAEIRRKFDEIVAFAEVEKFLDTPVKHYSSGMYVRLAFAVAAHLEPDILIVDEVLAVGDAAFQKKCLGKMGEVARGQGRTVLFVSHNMNAVQALCGRALWLNRGRIEQCGPVADVVTRYTEAGISGVPAKTWSESDAPGDDRVRLLGVRILQSGEVTMRVDINQPAQIEFDFIARKECRNLITGFNFYDASGVCLFAHCDWRPNRLAPGTYRKRIELPAQLFAEGSVQVLIQLVFHDPMVLSLILPDVLTFEAVDSDSPDAVRGLYHGHWPGMVRVALKWSDAQAVPPSRTAAPTPPS